MRSSSRSSRAGADSGQPMSRRKINLVSAVEKFQMFGGFRRSFAQLHAVTGSRPRDWSAEQLDIAAQLLGDAHRSWMTYLRKAEKAAHLAKRLPHYKPVEKHQLLSDWRRAYLTPERAEQWRFVEGEATQQDHTSQVANGQQRDA